MKNPKTRSETAAYTRYGVPTVPSPNGRTTVIWPDIPQPVVRAATIPATSNESENS